MLQFGKKFDLVAEKILDCGNNDFLKSSKFSPDGSVILTSSESNYLGLWSVDSCVSSKCTYHPEYSNHTHSTNQKLDIYLDLAINNGDSVYDFFWYPYMVANDTATCCFITTSRDHPIHLWDSSSGQIRASYRGFNRLDELEAAQCVTFNCTGDKIYSGCSRMIRCFDVSQPGRNFIDFPTSSSRKDASGQKGIISAISFNPDYSGVYAAGSYAHSLGIYVENQRDCVLEMRDLEFGVTHLRWSPCGNKLWVGGRKHPDIICYDIRGTGLELGRISRALTTNQRMSFDLDPWGKHVVTGSQDGQVLVFDAESFNLVAERNAPDCVNAVSFHPTSSLLALSCGQRHFSSNYEDEGLDDGVVVGPNSERRKMPQPTSAIQVLEIGRCPFESEVAVTDLSIIAADV